MRAAIYARSATHDHDALLRQEGRCRAYAAERGWEVVDVWAESGSGVAPALPGLEALLAAVEAGAADVVVVTSPDRISRDVRRMWAVVDRLRAAGVGVAWVDGQDLAGELWMAITRWHDVEGAR